MELCSILPFLEEKAILVTGATGFLAKVFTEKILRAQPNVKKLYLLLRAQDQNSAAERFKSEVIAKDLFRVLKEKYEGDVSPLISEKVQVVCGDITYEKLGVKDSELLQEMWEQVDVVVNLAANTNFDERYDVSLGIGVINVLDFCKKCDKLKILVHVSTSYVSGEKEGLILETSHKMGVALNGTTGLDLFVEKKLVEETLKQLKENNSSQDSIKFAMKDLGIERARKFGWPNTYVFTKAMGEMLVGEVKEELPVVIIRPTIVTSTYNEPFPGWIEGARTIDAVIVSYAKGKVACFLSGQDTIYDLIPADMVVNAMIAAMVAHCSQANERIIYHVGSSVSNPFRLKWLVESCFKYFTTNPCISKDGKPIIVQKCAIFNTMKSFEQYMQIRYLLPLKVLGIANTVCCQYFKTSYIESFRKLKIVMRLVYLYKPYSMSKGVYDDINTEKLRNAAKECEIETDTFYFDPKSINWDDYIMNINIPGLVNTYSSKIAKKPGKSNTYLLFNHFDEDQIVQCFILFLNILLCSLFVLLIEILLKCANKARNKYN